jgi:hypothetical protein
MSNPMDWLTPEGMEAHIDRVWLKHFGFPRPAQRAGRDPQGRVTPGGVHGMEGTTTKASYGEITIDFTRYQGSVVERVQRLRIEFPAEGSSEIVVRFGPVDAACGQIEHSS